MKVFDKRDETQKKKDASLSAMAIRGEDLDGKGRGRRGKSSRDQITAWLSCNQTQSPPPSQEWKTFTGVRPEAWAENGGISRAKAALPVKIKLKKEPPC